MSNARRRPARRKEAAASDAAPAVKLLSADVGKFCSRPVAESPWGKQGLAEIQVNGDRHFRPERLPSSRKERPKSARLTNLYSVNVDFLQNVAETLRTLDLSNTGLFAFPQELAERLFNIETLILDHNSITNDGFPQCFKDLVSLNFLSVRHNRLTSIPSTWTLLFQMHTLYADGNDISSVRHLEKLNKLRILSLQSNKLQELPREFYSIKKLEYLNLSWNSIASLTVDVKRWINMKELDLSHNKLTFLIPDIFLLPKLEGLQLSHNAIAKIPTVRLKTKDKRIIQSVDISNNCLTRFPENVFAVTQSLDLSSNSIKVINNSAFKKLEWRTTKELCVQDNPLNTPPRDICEGGLRSMLHYYFETKVESKIYQGIKIFLLGSRSCGKSSLLQTFLDQQSRLTTDDEETIGIEIYDYAIDTNDDPSDPKPLSLSLWDCSGHADQQQYIYPFLHVPSLAMIMFDLSQYSNERFHEQIGQWIDTLTLRNNRAVFILIGTKADLCNKKVNPAAVLEQAQKDTEEYIKAYLDSIDHEIVSIERLDQISAAFNEQYRQYLSLKNFKPLFHPEALVTSSKQMLGFDRLEAVLVELATQTKTFPAVMRVIPALWGDVDNYLEDFGQNQSIITFKDLEAIVHKLFALRHLTGQICQYMHESGKVIYCDKEEPFKDAVVLRPSSLFEFARLVFRPDLHAFLTDPGDKEEIRERFMKTQSEQELDTAVALATQQGILTLSLIKTLWGTGKRRFALVNFLCDNLKWCHRIGGIKEKPEGDSLPRYDLNFDIERNDDGSVKTDTYKVNLLVPSLVQCPEPPEAQKKWARARFRVSAAFRFTRFQPLMFFEKLLASLHSEQLRFSYHWRGGLLAFHSNNPFVWLRVSLEDPEDKSYLVMLSCGVVTSDTFDTARTRQRVEEPSSGEQVKIEQDHSEAEDSPASADASERDEVAETDGADDRHLPEQLLDEETQRLFRQTAHIWKCLLPALLEAEKLLKQYSAAWFRREVQCPECKEMTFWGEWLSPKEAQEQEFKGCRACHSEVRTCLLVQPRLSKRQPSAPSSSQLRRLSKSSTAGSVAEVAGEVEDGTDPDLDGLLLLPSAQKLHSQSASTGAIGSPSTARREERRKSVTFVPGLQGAVR